MKRLLLFAVAGLLSVSVVAQVFKVGDTRANLSIGVGSLSSPEASRATFDQHFTMEWGVASIGDKFTIGLGFSVNNNFRNTGSSVVFGTYDYTYSYSYSERKRGSSNVTYTTKTQRRNGSGHVECDLLTDHVDLLFDVSFHYSPVRNLDVYGIVGAGVGVITYIVSNIGDDPYGFSSYSTFSGSEYGDYRKPSGIDFGYWRIGPYSYNDLDHVQWQDEYDATFVPSIAIYIGATYYFTEHWGVDLQVGLLNANFCVSEEDILQASSFGTFAVGATYKF